MVAASLHILLSELIDYAGLFPPAALSMEQAVGNYAEYKASVHSWMLGRFIVPIARLAEFERAAQASPSATSTWKLSVLNTSPADESEFQATLTQDVQDIIAFNQLHVQPDKDTTSRFLIDAIEIKDARIENIAPAIDAVWGEMDEEIEIFFEAPLANRTRKFVDDLSYYGGCAKVRTGGLAADAFPPSSQLINFVTHCDLNLVDFKATAGLHHPLRGTHRFTYEEDSAQGTMHGFLNLFLAAAFIRHALHKEDAALLLDETSPDAFRFTDEGVEWRGEKLTNRQLHAGREFARSFGSCSFTEPLDDLRALNLL